MGNTGFEFSQPFFWAIDPHRDVTFSPMLYFNDENFNTNGAKLHTEYNQWVGSKSRLKFTGALMYDDTYLDINGDSNPDSRWFLDYSNYFILPRNIIQKSNFTLLKERTYLNDFQSEVRGRGEAALKNKFSLSKAKGNQFFSSEVIYYINLLVSDPSNNDNLSIHKLPELKYAVTKTPFWSNRLLFDADVTYTNFHRNGRSFDELNKKADPDLITKDRDLDANGDGLFDAEKDLIRTGQRLRLNAEISAPFKLGDYFDVLPALNYRDSYYNFNMSKDSVINNTDFTPYSQFAFSRYLEASTSIRTEFARVYGEKYKHKVIPELKYRIGSPVNQSENIFFNSQGDLPFHRQYQPITDEEFYAFDHGVQFDYWDRFFRADVLEFSLTNIFIRKNKEELITYYDQPFFFNLTQSYDFRNAHEVAEPDPWSNLDGVLKLTSKHFNNFSKLSYFYKAEKINISTQSTFKYKSGRFISIDYSDFRTVTEKGDLTDNRTKNVGLGLGWEFPTLKISGGIGYSLLQKRHLGWQTNLTYTPRGNCWGIDLRLLQLDTNRNKLGYKLNFHFNFGPDPRARKSLQTI